MKPSSLFHTLWIALFAILPQLRAQEMTPIIPTGSLSAFPTIVQAGTHPTLTWDVVLPERINDVVDIDGPGTLVPTRRLIMDVRVLGASVKRVWTNHWGQITKWEWVPTEAKISYNGGSFTRIFYDTHNKVNPNTIVHTQVVEANSTVDFGARYLESNGSWGTWYSSTNSQHNVIALKNGDIPPTTTPLYQQPSIESFLLPYLDSEGKITLGARDIIYLMELTHTNRNDGGFDLQDMALLVSFYDEVSNNGNGNNGHGNNEDGVDSSNPGNASFVDSDPNEDDERRGRRRR